MKAKIVAAIALTAFMLCGAVLVSRFAMGQSQSVPYQGQNTGRFQMFFSPVMRRDTFLLDTGTGFVWQQQQAPNGNVVFSLIHNTDQPIVYPPVVGRFRVYFSPIVRADTYLLDSSTGQVYQMFEDSDDKHLFFMKRTVDGITKN